MSGRITVDGEPVAQGHVVFVPEAGRRATAKIDGDGRFTLSTYGSGDGAIVGRHQVGVTAFADMEQYRRSRYDDSQKVKPPAALAPAAYADPFSSGLTFEVVSGADNTADFDLRTSGTR